MIYVTLKAVHIVAVIVWIGSLLLLTVVASFDKLTTSQLKVSTRITEFGIGLTWLAGIVLVVQGSWYFATWWQIKIVVVIVISAVHTILHRRWQRQDEAVTQVNPLIPCAIFVSTVVVVFLAVFKQP